MAVRCGAGLTAEAGYWKAYRQDLVGFSGINGGSSYALAGPPGWVRAPGDCSTSTSTSTSISTSTSTSTGTSTCCRRRTTPVVPGAEIAGRAPMHDADLTRACTADPHCQHSSRRARRMYI